MIKIQIKNNELSIEDEERNIFNWRHRAFFNISLGFDITEKNDRYFYSDTNEFQDIIREVISYLKEEKIDFTTDQQVSNLISNIQDQDTEFVEVRENLNKKIPISQSISFQRKLKSYQIKGVEYFLQIKHGANFSVPGSGKTTMVYAYFDKLKEEGIVNKIFVVGPFSSFSPW